MPRTKSEIAANARRKDLLSNFRTNIATLKAGDLDDMDYRRGKVEKILKGNLNSIPSPSSLMKIQIIIGKICLRGKGKTLLGDVNKLFVFKSLLTMPNNVLPLYLKQFFPLII